MSVIKDIESFLLKKKYDRVVIDEQTKELYTNGNVRYILHGNEPKSFTIDYIKTFSTLEHFKKINFPRKKKSVK